MKILQYINSIKILAFATPDLKSLPWMLISTDIVSDISQEKVTKLKWKIYFILDAFDTNLMQLQIIIEIMNNKEII